MEETIMIIHAGGVKEIPYRVDENESSMWDRIGKAIAELELPNEPQTLSVICGSGVAEIRVEAGEDRAVLTPGKNSIYFDDWCQYPMKKLVKIDVEKNIHALYELHPNNMGTRTMDIGAKWGQTGGGNAGANKVEDMFVLRSPWRPWFFWVKYHQLLKAGYDDVTELLVDEEEMEEEFSRFFGKEDGEEDGVSETADPDSAALKLYEVLQESATQFLVNDMGLDLDFFSSKPPFNRRQISSAQKKHKELLKILSQIGTDEEKIAKRTETEWIVFIDDFNEAVKKLIVATDIKFRSGKDKKTVASFMIRYTRDHKKILDAMTEAAEMWESTILAMEALITTKDTKVKKVVSPFGNVDVRYATEEETKEILDRFHADEMGKEYSYKIYMLDCHDFKERQKKYAEERGITKFEKLIHGSPTQNWVSLIKNHPLINPGFTTAGKAYGWGVYTARDLRKSLGYTSIGGSRWAHGNSRKGFIGVSNCAYGNPYFPKGVADAEKATREGGFDCCDARARWSGFVMDEIIFYEEAALCFEAIIEITETD